MAPASWRGAGWVLAETTPPATRRGRRTTFIKPDRKGLFPLPMIRRRSSASSSFVLAATRLRALSSLTPPHGGVTRAAARKIPEKQSGPQPGRHHSSHRAKTPCPLDAGGPHGCRELRGLGDLRVSTGGCERDALHRGCCWQGMQGLPTRVRGCRPPFAYPWGPAGLTPPRAHHCCPALKRVLCPRGPVRALRQVRGPSDVGRWALAAISMVSEEEAMHPMFAELFMKPDEELEASDRRRLRRARRSRQLRTLSVARGASGRSQSVPTPRRAA